MPANGRGVQLVVAVSAAVAAAAWAICTSSSCAAWAPHATAAREMGRGAGGGHNSDRRQKTKADR